MAQLVGRKLVGRLSLHTDRDSGVALKRKRVQPVGSKLCGCGRMVSANKDSCAGCVVGVFGTVVAVGKGDRVTA